MRLKKKQGLRIVSSVLAASMALSVFPTTAFAANGMNSTGETENSIVEPFAEESEDNLTTLKFDKDGFPIGEGSEEEGWTYDGSTLTIEEGFVFDRPNQVVNCFVTNRGEIKDGTFNLKVDSRSRAVITGGTFKQEVETYGVQGGHFEDTVTIWGGTVEGDPVFESSVSNFGEIKNGLFKASVYNYASGVNISGGKFEGYVNNNGLIKGGEFTGSVTNSGTIQNVSIAYLSSNSGIVRNCVFGSDSDKVSVGSRAITFNSEALVNDVISLSEDDLSSKKVYVVGDREVKVKYTGDLTDFVSWESDRELNWAENADKTEITFTMPEDAITLTAKEKVYELTFDGENKPVGKGNKYSGWTYDGTTLTFNKGYTFDKDQVVDCPVDNYGTIKNGTFQQDVVNKDGDEKGVISGGTFEGKVSNDGAISGGDFNVVYNNGSTEASIQNAKIKLLSYGSSYKNINDSLFRISYYATDPENARRLTVYGARINDFMDNNGEYLYVIGNYKIKVEYTGGADDFDKWSATPEVNWTESADKKTVTFDMPDTNVVMNALMKQYYTIEVENGKATVDGEEIEKAKKDDVVTITANAAAEGREFAGWNVIEGGITLADASKTETTFTMGESAVRVEATYKDKATTKPTEPSKPDTPSEPEVKTYAVTVTNGKATVDGEKIEKAKKDDVVTITANAAAEGKEFAGWNVVEGGVTLADASKAETTFTMGENAVKVEATYKDKATTKPTEPSKPTTPSEPEQKDDGAGALIVGGILVAGGVATGVIVYNMAMDYIKSSLPEGTEIPKTREELATALWENAGKPEVTVEEGVELTDTQKAMRWAVENKVISAEGEDTVSKFDVLKAVYKAKNL